MSTTKKKKIVASYHKGLYPAPGFPSKIQHGTLPWSYESALDSYERTTG